MQRLDALFLMTALTVAATTGCAAPEPNAYVEQIEQLAAYLPGVWEVEAPQTPPEFVSGLSSSEQLSREHSPPGLDAEQLKQVPRSVRLAFLPPHRPDPVWAVEPTGVWEGSGWVLVTVDLEGLPAPRTYLRSYSVRSIADVPLSLSIQPSAVTYAVTAGPDTGDLLLSPYGILPDRPTLRLRCVGAIPASNGMSLRPQSLPRAIAKSPPR